MTAERFDLEFACTDQKEAIAAINGMALADVPGVTLVRSPMIKVEVVVTAVVEVGEEAEALPLGGIDDFLAAARIPRVLVRTTPHKTEVLA